MYGYEIEPPPSELTGAAVLCRMVDGLAFRYHWATEALRDEDYEFRPGPESMSLRQLLKHVLQLAFMIQQVAENAPKRERFRGEDPDEVRARTLGALERARRRLETLRDDEVGEHRIVRRDGSYFPVWNIMNGPLADALTHVGQINAWRRLSGNPQPAVDVFAGVPPTDR